MHQIKYNSWFDWFDIVAVCWQTEKGVNIQSEVRRGRGNPALSVKHDSQLSKARFTFASTDMIFGLWGIWNQRKKMMIGIEVE